MSVNFQEVRDSIYKAQQMLDGVVLDAAGQQKLLEARAARFAEDRSSDLHKSAKYSVIEVRRGEHRLGLPSSAMREVRTVKICVLPHSRSTIVGLFHIRGETFCAIDLLPMLRAADPVVLAHGDNCMVAVVENENGKIGLRIDEVIGPRTIAEDEVANELDEAGIDFIEAVTDDLLSVVELDKLLSRSEVIMNTK